MPQIVEPRIRHYTRFVTFLEPEPVERIPVHRSVRGRIGETPTRPMPLLPDAPATRVPPRTEPGELLSQRA